MSFLKIQNIRKSYVPGEPVIRGVDLEVNEGEILVLLGSSGCGKTTLLKTIAGLEEQDAGSIVIDGVDMAGVRTEKRPIAMVFQKSLLFRNMTVEQNINFAPRVNRTMSKAEYQKRTEELLELIDMPGMGKKRATELSGGQEQRVSLARALMTQPKVLLLDEPLSALDAKLRVSMRQHIRRLNAETGTTMVFVTHDQQEAVEMASRIALMHDGRILQYARPQEFYTHPASYEVAEFFNWKNYVPAMKVGPRVACALGEFLFPTSDLPDGPCVLCIRPEAARVVQASGCDGAAGGVGDAGDGVAAAAGAGAGGDGAGGAAGSAGDAGGGSVGGVAVAGAGGAGGGSVGGVAVAGAGGAGGGVVNGNVDGARCETGVFEGAVQEVVPLGPLSKVIVRVRDVVLELSVRSTDAAHVGETQRFVLDPRMIWPVAPPSDRLSGK